MKTRSSLQISKGFTLLEVMIAVAIMAIALVTLIGSQSQSVAIMSDVRFETAAAFLAREKITELRVEDFDQLSSDKGSFEDDFSQFLWNSEIVEITDDDVGMYNVANMLKEVTLVITHADDSRQEFSVKSVFCRKIVAREEQ